MTISIEKNTGRSTSREAANTTLKTFGRPSRRVASPSRRAMFSAMMTAPSTMMPKSMAPIDSRPMGMLVKYISTRANSSEKGIVTATRAAMDGRPRNSNNTSTTSVMPSDTLCATVCSVLSTRY